jgi:hypothetical protein
MSRGTYGRTSGKDIALDARRLRPFLAAGGVAAHDQVHGIVGSDHTVTGAALDVIGLSATDTLGILTPSAAVSSATSVLLKTDSNGRLQIRGLGIGAAAGANAITMADDTWIGLGAAAGRIVFDDQANDFISLMDAWVGVGIAGPADLFHVYGGGLKVEGDGDATHPDTGGTIILQNTSLSGLGVNDDVAGMVRAMGLNAVGDAAQCADIYFQMTDVADGAQSSALRFLTQLAGADVFLMNLVEDKVGINKLTPAESLDVVGNIFSDSQVRGFSLRATDSIQLNNQKVFGFLNTAASGYLFTVSTNSNDDLFFYDQGTKNTYILRTTLNGGGTADLQWGENTANQSFLSLGLGTQGGRFAMGSEIVMTAEGSGGGTTAVGIGIDGAAEKLHVYDGVLKVEGQGDEDVTGGTIYLQNKPSLVGGTPANGDVAGMIRAFGINAAGNASQCVDLYFQMTNVATGLQDTAFRVLTQKDGNDAFVLNVVEDKVGINELTPTAALHVAGDLLVEASGTVAVLGDGSGAIRINMNGAAGSVRNVQILSGGSLRWVVGANSEAESGSNAGSTFNINSYDDSGTFLASVVRIRRSDGAVQVGAPTDGYKGTGTLNAQGVYDDGTLLTPYVLEAAVTGAINMPALDAKVPNRTIPAKMRTVPAKTKTVKGGINPKTRERLPDRVEIIEPEYEEEIEPEGIEERIHGPARRFAANMEEELDPVQYAAKWQRDGHLPAFHSEAEWEAAGNFPIGDLLNRLMETDEVQAVHISKILDRLTAVEASLNN